jgi:hypothetical protein
MMCVAFPPVSGVPHRLVSGADEKLLRVFDAPECFLRLLTSVSAGGGAGARVVAAPDTVTRVEQAFVPELALSNKVCAKGCSCPDVPAGVPGMQLVCWGFRSFVIVSVVVRVTSLFVIVVVFL